MIKMIKFNKSIYPLSTLKESIQAFDDYPIQLDSYDEKYRIVAVDESEEPGLGNEFLNYVLAQLQVGEQKNGC